MLPAGRTRNRGSIRGKCGSCCCYSAFKPELWSTQTPVHCEKWNFTLGVKRPGREAYHSPRCSAKVQNDWSYTPK